MQVRVKEIPLVGSERASEREGGREGEGERERGRDRERGWTAWSPWSPWCHGVVFGSLRHSFFSHSLFIPLSLVLGGRRGRRNRREKVRVRVKGGNGQTDKQAE